MDAIKFIYEARRRYNMTGKVCSVLSDCYTPENIVNALEEWVKEHPFKTRQSEFLKEWPDTYLDGLLHICADCRKQYWCEEIKQER